MFSSSHVGQFRVDASTMFQHLAKLSEEHVALSMQTQALRLCLEEVGIVSSERVLARCHRLQFQRALRTHPCTLANSLEHSLVAPDLMLTIVKSSGYEAALSLSLCSRSLQKNLLAIWQDVELIFPPSIHVIGGISTPDSWTVLPTLETLNLSGSWTIPPLLAAPRLGFVVAEWSGQIYVTGGRNCDGRVQEDTQIYVPSRNRWMNGPELVWRRAQASGTVARGKFLVAGGVVNPWDFARQDDLLQDAELCLGVETLELRSGISDMDVWQPHKHSGVARYASAATALGSHVYIMGGFGTRSQEFDVVERFDLEGDTWSLIEPLKDARGYLAAVSALGCIYAIGGMKGNGDLVGIVERLDPAIGAWEILVPLTVPRCASSAIHYSGNLLVLGGGIALSQQFFSYDRSFIALAGDPGAVRFDLKIGQWFAIEPTSEAVCIERDSFVAICCRPEASRRRGQDGCHVQ